MSERGALFTVGRDVDGVPLFPQSLLDEAGDFAIVFHDEDFHDWQSRDLPLNRV